MSGKVSRKWKIRDNGRTAVIVLAVPATRVQALAVWKTLKRLEILDHDKETPQVSARGLGLRANRKGKPAHGYV